MAAINKRDLKITVAGTEFNAQVSNVTIESAASDSDFTTFADASAGGARAYTLNMTIVQDTGSTSLWNQVWANAGTTVACVLRPSGNATPSTTQPHYSFSAIVSEPDGTLLGGDADSSATAYQTVEVAWALLAKPTKVTT